MLNDLKQKNNSIKELRLKLKQTNTRSILELEEILASVADRKAFILLLDSFETEKSITRDLLESLIDQTYELNSGMIDYMENEINFSKAFTDIFKIENIKSIVVFAIATGLIIAIITNDELASKIVGAVIKTEETSNDKSK